MLAPHLSPVAETPALLVQHCAECNNCRVMNLQTNLTEVTIPTKTHWSGHMGSVGGK